MARSMSATEDGVTMTCRICGHIGPPDDMTKDRRSPLGRMSRCKRCSSEVTKSWARRNPERAAEINRASKERNRERAKQRRRDRVAALRGDPNFERHERDRRIRRFYGVSQDWFEDQLDRQGGRCAICGVPQAEKSRTFSIDHDHGCCPSTPTCGRCNRGLLCGPCNLALAAFERRQDWTDRALTYLRSWVE